MRDGRKKGPHEAGLTLIALAAMTNTPIFALLGAFGCEKFDSRGLLPDPRYKPMNSEIRRTTDFGGGAEKSASTGGGARRAARASNVWATRIDEPSARRRHARATWASSAGVS